MAGIRDRLSCQNILNLLVRIPLATLSIHFFSHWLFTRDRAIQLIQIFTKNPMFHLPGRAAQDLSTIQKMARFWPPHKGYGMGEFSLVFTICLVLFIKLIDFPTVTKSIFGIRCTSPILNFLVTPIYTTFIPFILLFPMMRLSEMHIFVLLLNFIHILVSSYIVYAFWYFMKTEKDCKEKTE
ncbi:DUF2189 domain-containing protein [Caenorhabditis elegans]|uniref:DUF2189 domain-containing protein n=1 Tax=Caenorhabditis elegans TaxID=6239 RepID=A3FPI3_CAEEL|nr:DUF2189 domain-containing protein [Caenorhabditis elegans]CCD66011.1 DUF2189 domain-containing protein [Caenorhabditis elegans]|eukprot:NP_001122681.1 Uncharacterized protein CELE_C29E4.15 [Caenorhabditis elegans]